MLLSPASATLRDAPRLGLLPGANPLHYSSQPPPSLYFPLSLPPPTCSPPPQAGTSILPLAVNLRQKLPRAPSPPGLGSKTRSSDCWRLSVIERQEAGVKLEVGRVGGRAHCFQLLLWLPTLIPRTGTSGVCLTLDKAPESISSTTHTHTGKTTDRR